MEQLTTKYKLKQVDLELKLIMQRLGINSISELKVLKSVITNKLGLHDRYTEILKVEEGPIIKDKANTLDPNSDLPF